MIRVPAGLRWLVSPDPRPERATPDPIAELTDEEIDAVVRKFAENIARALHPIDMVRLRAFVEALPAVHHRPTTWPMTAPTPRDVLERAFPKSCRKEGR